MTAATDDDLPGERTMTGPGGRARPVGTLVLAALGLVVSAVVGGLASRFVIGFTDLRSWRADLIVTMVTTGLATATTSYLLCERLLPARVGRSRRAARQLVRDACVLGGLLLAGLLLPLTPESWLQALPASAFVTLTGGLGVAAAAARSRRRERG